MVIIRSIQRSTGWLSSQNLIGFVAFVEIKISLNVNISLIGYLWGQLYIYIHIYIQGIIQPFLPGVKPTGLWGLLGIYRGLDIYWVKGLVPVLF